MAADALSLTGAVVAQAAPASDVQLTGTQLASALIPASSFGAGYRLEAGSVADYTTTDFVSAACQLDVAFAPVAGDYSLRTLQVIRDGGHLVSILDVPEDALKAAAARGISAGFTLVEPDRLALSAITELVNSGALPATPETGARWQPPIKGRTGRGAR